MFVIQINLESEGFNNVEYYFWCVMKKKGDELLNYGHGWEKDIQSAAIEAYHHYLSNIINS